MYQRGNPQRRVFLPNFWLKLVKPEHDQPKNIVEFHCSMEMTRFDVRNYLEKIYNVHPVYVNVRIALGKTYIPRGCKFVVKDDDVKIAYVALVSIKEKKLNFEQKDDKNIVNTSNTHFV